MLCRALCDFYLLFTAPCTFQQSAAIFLWCFIARSQTNNTPLQEGVGFLLVGYGYSVIAFFLPLRCLFSLLFAPHSATPHSSAGRTKQQKKASRISPQLRRQEAEERSDKASTCLETAKSIATLSC